MTNVSIEPGDGGTLADLIADVDDGLYLETNRSWSIDDRRLQFQFATEIAREIRGGKLGRLLRNPTYAGVTPDFWASLDAVAVRRRGGSGGCATAARASPASAARVARRGAGPLPRRRGRRRVTGGLELAERALERRAGRRRGGPRDERALAAAALRPLAPHPGHRHRRRVRRAPVLRDGHAGGASTNPTIRRAGGMRPRRERPPGDRPPSGPGRLPRLPAAPAPPPGEGFDADTARLDPAPAGAALAAASRCRAPRRGGLRHLDGRRGGDRGRGDHGRGRSDPVTDAFMKVICRAASGRSGYAAHTAGRSPRSTRARWPARRGEGSRASPSELPPGGTRSCSSRTRSASCSSSSALAFNGLAHAEGRGALSGRLGQRSPRRHQARGLAASPHAAAASTPRACRRRRCR